VLTKPLGGERPSYPQRFRQYAGPGFLISRVPRPRGRWPEVEQWKIPVVLLGKACFALRRCDVTSSRLTDFCLRCGSSTGFDESGDVNASRKKRRTRESQKEPCGTLLCFKPGRMPGKAEQTAARTPLILSIYRQRWGTSTVVAASDSNTAWNYIRGFNS
jgi:hypothetical protein